MAEYLPVLVCIAAFAMDAILGEPRFHPLIGFGKLASAVEKKFNYHKSKFAGVFSVFVLVLLPSFCFWAFLDNLNNTFQSPQINSISLKILYYLDYHYLVKKK